MTDTTTLGFPEAARHFGVPVRVLRRAIRDGKIPAPEGKVTAASGLSAAWLDRAQAAYETAPKALNRISRQKVPPFARYEGTSCWRKYRGRVKAYYRFLAVG